MNYYIHSLLLLSDGPWIGIVAACAVVFGVAGFFIGRAISEKIRKAKIETAEAVIAKMKEEAEQECKAIKKEAILEAKEQEIKLRNDFERDTREKKAELQRAEQRLNQKEELLNKRDASLLKQKEELEQQKKDLDRRVVSIQAKQEKIDQQYESVVQKLEEISGLSKEEAKKQLTETILDDTRKDVAMQVRSMEQEAKDEADKKAKDIISLAIQKCCTDHASEITVSVVPLPRIEETVEKVRKELDVQIKEAGEAAMFEVGLFGIHPELIKLLGRLKYRTSYGQNVLQHSLEVSHLAGLMAAELGVDVNLAKRGGLLHDISVRLSISRSKALIFRSASTLRRSTKKTKTSLTVFRLTTATWSLSA